MGRQHGWNIMVSMKRWEGTGKRQDGKTAWGGHIAFDAVKFEVTGVLGKRDRAERFVNGAASAA